MLAPLKLGSKVFDWREVPYLVGILNVTPDSFSDGGKFVSIKSAITRVKELLEEGADIIDVGGESTRPFADPVPVEEEIERVIPVIKAIRQEFPEVILSVDTYKSKVAEKALEVGAHLINDISAGTFDPRMVEVIRDYQCPYVIMHIKGTPKTMQINPEYKDVVEEIKDFLSKRIEFLVEKGIKFENIIIDPGLGFGKTLEHNVEILKRIDEFFKLKRPILLGHSRKSFIGILTNRPDPLKREGGTVGTSLWAYLKGIHFLRVHRVDLSKDAITMFKFLTQQEGRN